MAVNLINSNDITITQTGENIQLSTTVDIQTLESNVSTNTSDIENLQNGNVYSTNEVDTGKIWVDGKPIYRKVVTGTLPTENYSTFITIDNLDTPISESILITMADNSKLRLPFVQLVNNIYCDYYITGNTYNVHFTVNSYKSRPFIAILEYTKTTD